MLVYAGTRLQYTQFSSDQPVKVTTWDALGYYYYLPALLIYHDVDDLKFIPAIDQTYQLSGGDFYQATRLPNGHYAGKYFVGVAILQAPFFLMAHALASSLGFPADGFSAPYQLAIAWGALLYMFLALLLLRRILLRYFTDSIVAYTLLLTLLATNALQYIAVEGGQSHAYIFPLYALMLYATLRWHESFRLRWLVMMGVVLGLASICRPTEAVMLFIPLLWDWHDKERRQRKWQYLTSHASTWLIGGLSLLVAVSPQLMYWKMVTDHWVYDVGSKWDFLNPHFRVLVGWEKGWFIYTPVTVLMCLGLWKLEKSSFSKAVMVFSLLNIYIIIAWHIWRYGGSYSCRALVQSYPVWTFALAALLTAIQQQWLKVVAIIVGIYLIAVNLFQVYQYNETILHYDHMNRSYYGAIYLNPHPTPLDYSLLDSAATPSQPSKYQTQELVSLTTEKIITPDSILYHQVSLESSKAAWIFVHAEMTVQQGLWDSYLVARVQQAGQWHEQKIRLFQPQAVEGKRRRYEFYLRLDEAHPIDQLQCQLIGNNQCKAILQELKINALSSLP